MSETPETTTTERVEPRLKEHFDQEVVPRMMERFGLENRMAVPRLRKIAINIGVGEAVENASALSDAIEILRIITGQQPATTRARRSVAGFQLREGVPIGARVTLRGDRMYEFLDRLISVALPRVRDFRGLSPNSFDGTGNYSLGLAEAVVWPEIDLDELDTVHGMDITIVTSARTDQEAFELLRLLGMPFRQ
jgi:large subunit ribosomal protein L5